MDSLVNNRSRLLVRQDKEWGEILLGFESKNRYVLMEDSGEVIGRAAEEAQGFGAMLLRNVLGHCRAAKVHLYDPSGEELGLVDKPFRWYFHRCDLYERGRFVGAVQRKFSLLNRVFVIEDEAGNELLTIKSPLFRVWTFKLLLGDMEVGRISKKWGGMLREMFTDADTFGVEFSEEALDPEVKKILVGAVFLIDFTCFENNTGGRGMSFDFGS